MILSKIISAYQNQQFENCLSMINEIQTPLNQEFTQLKASCYQKTKQYEKAMETWDLAIANFGEQPDFLLERGICKFHLKYKSSLLDMDKAIDLEPNNEYYYACRAYIKDKIGDTEGSVADYQKAHELDPRNEITLNNLGLAEEKLGYTQKARQRFKQADEIAGIDHITAKYFDIQNTTDTSPKNSIGKEIFKMISSKKEFVSFLNEAAALFKLKK
ncbi:MAG: tetratricopeptide repeat protein [Flavobacteriales bacterium]|nr:tetratricopeptide repeat protein [Flavobacteriales bacterium]